EEVVRIESVDLIRSLFPAQQNLLGSIAATYIAETVDTFAQADDPSELIYRLLDRTTEAILEGAAPMAVVAYAEVWILRLTGILPSLRNCIVCDAPLGRPLRYDARVQGFVCDSCTSHGVEIIPNDVADALEDRKSTRLNSSHSQISYAVFCLKKKKKMKIINANSEMIINTIDFALFPSSYM